MDQLEEYRRLQEQRYKQASQTHAPVPPPPTARPIQPPPQPANIPRPIQPPPQPPRPPQQPAYQQRQQASPEEERGRQAPYQTESDEEIARKLQAQFYSEEQQPVRPPMNVQRQERLVEPYYAYPQAARQPLLSQSPPQFQAPPPPTSFWPTVPDKCCGVSTQRVVLGTAAGMVAVIIILLIVLAST